MKNALVIFLCIIMALTLTGFLTYTDSFFEYESQIAEFCDGITDRFYDVTSLFNLSVPNTYPDGRYTLIVLRTDNPVFLAVNTGSLYDHIATISETHGPIRYTPFTSSNPSLINYFTVERVSLPFGSHIGYRFVLYDYGDNDFRTFQLMLGTFGFYVFNSQEELQDAINQLIVG